MAPVSLNRLRNLLVAYTASVVVGMGGVRCNSSYASPLELTDAWRPLVSGILVKEITLNPNALFPSRIVFARIDPDQVRVKVLRASEFGFSRLSAHDVAVQSNAHLVINANFFDEHGAPLGLVLSNGTMHHPIHRGGRTLTGVFQELHRGFAIVHRDSFSPHGVVEAVQAGPRLLAGGAPVEGVKDSLSTRRSGICINKEGAIIIFCVSSGLFSFSIQSLQDLLLSESLNCVDALNLDGGSSSQLYARTTLESGAASETVSVEGTDRVPVFIGFFASQLREEEAQAAELQPPP